MTRMPRTVLFPVIFMSIVTLLAVVLFGSSVLEILRDGVWPGGERTKGRPVFLQVVSIVWQGLLPLVFASQVRGLLRRSEPERKWLFGLALTVSIVCGIGALTLGVVAAASPPRDLSLFAAALTTAVPFTALAWSLSRPSAKAWFQPGPLGR